MRRISARRSFGITSTVRWLPILIGVFAVPVLAVDIAGPLSMEDIRQLRRQGQQPKDIVSLVATRRLSFEIDPQAERALRGLGFRRSMIDAMKEAQRAAEPMEDPGAVPAGEDEPKLRRAADPKQEAAHQAFAARVQRINAVSGVDMTLVPSTSIAVIADRNTVNKYFPLVRQIEGTIRKTFPPPLGTGPDPRSTYLVLLRSDREYEPWIKAMHTVNHQLGVQRLDPIQLAAALQAAGSISDGISIANMKRTGGWARRAIAFNIGFLYMQRMTEGKAPAALLSGFGNMSEATLDGNPQIVLGAVNYAEQNVPQSSGNRWIRLLQRQLAAGQLDSVQQLMAYRFTAMKEVQYAEAWSLTQLLVKDPARFTKLTEAIRAGQEPVEAIQAIYGVDQQKLQALWQQMIAGVP
jgi:hypothetical protein